MVRHAVRLADRYALLFIPVTLVIAGAAWVVPSLGLLVFSLLSVFGQLVGAFLLDLLAPTPGTTVGWHLLAGLAMTPTSQVVEVTDRQIFSDGRREVSVHAVDNPHARGMLIGYVADQRLVLHYGDLSDSTNLIRIVQQVQPDRKSVV